jgi:hypothetical protein
MCTGLEVMALAQGASALAGGYAQQQAGRTQDALMQAEAAGVRDAAKAQADQVRRQTGRTRGAARAALAGAGVDVTQGSATQIQQDIDQRGEDEALQTLLTGERRARNSEFQGRQARQVGNAAMVQSALSAVQGYGMSRWRTGSGSMRAPWEASAPIVERSSYPGRG